MAGLIAVTDPTAGVTAEPRPLRAQGPAYMRWLRARNPGKTQHTKAVQAARDRALLRLAEAHPEQMRVLYDDELRKAGLRRAQ